jgi:hypothetical protein
VVVDEQRPFSASRMAAGLINPVTGRRMVATWMIDELLPFAVEAYGRLTGLLGASFLAPACVTDFFPTAQMRLAFLKRLEEEGRYLRLPADEHVWDACFYSELGYGVIAPCHLVDMPGLLAAARRRMVELGVLREERFEIGEMEIAAGLGAGSAVGPGFAASGGWAMARRSGIGVSRRGGSYFAMVSGVLRILFFRGCLLRLTRGRR